VRPEPGKIFKGHRGQRLKEAGMPRQIAFPNQALGGAVDYVMEQSEIVVADGLAIEAYALVNADQMRRRIKASPESGSLQDGAESSGGRTLAVGAGDQHRRKTIFRMSQCGQQNPHVRQVELVRRRLRQFVAQCVHLRDCGFVGQGQLSAFSSWLLAFSSRVTVSLFTSRLIQKTPLKGQTMHRADNNAT